MTRDELVRIKRTVDERSYPGEWSATYDPPKPCVYVEGTDTRFVTCDHYVDAEFLESADSWMGPLIDEVFRLRAAVRTLGLVAQLGDNQIQSLLDGSES